MIVYAFTLMSILILTVLYHTKENITWKTFIIFLAGIILISVAGLRYNVGTDYPRYVWGFYHYANDFSLSLLSQPAVSLIAKLCKMLGNDYALWFYIMSLISIAPAVYCIRKHSEMPMLSISLFVLLGCWHFSFNIVKQTAAAAILLLGIDALVNKSFKRWLFVCIIASLFHFSALLMIPVYFLTSIKFSKKTLFISIVTGIVLYFAYDRLFDLAAFLKQGENLVGLYSSTRNDSVNILRVLVNCMPMILYWIFRKNINNDNNYSNTLITLSTLNVVLNFTTMNSIYLYRICVFTNIFNVLFIPYILSSVSHNNKRVIVPIMFILYTIFWWYDLYKGSSTIVFHWIFER